jgi:hypothetical protein
VWILAAVPCLSIMGAWVLVRESALAAFALPAVAGVVLLAFRMPHWLAPAGSLAAMSGGDFSMLAGVAQYALIIGGLTVSLRIAHSKTRLKLPVVAAGCLLLWLGVRTLVESSLASPAALLACLGVLVLATHVISEFNPDMVLRAFALSVVAFVATSWFVGVYDDTGLRYEGVSGNANRMVFALLVGIPVLLAAARNGSWIPRILYMTATATSVDLILRSGSDQGLVGLGVLFLALLVYLGRGYGRAAWVGVGMVATALVAILVTTSDWSRVSEDLTTLSGRTEYFKLGLNEFFQNPLVGTGNPYVSDSLGSGRSSHNTTISIAATGGIFAFCAWIALLGRAFGIGAGRLMGGDITGAMALALVGTQLVQQVELAPLTWLLIAMPALSKVGD